MKRLPDRVDMTAAARELTTTDRLYRRLHGLLLEEEVSAGGETGGARRKGKAPASPSPWNDTAGDLITTIHDDCRRFESAMTLLLFSRARYRGGDERNTIACLQALPDLIAAAIDQHPAPPRQGEPATREHEQAAEAARALTRWPVLARALLSEARPGEVPWTRAPGNLVCPHCEQRLVLAPGWQDHPESADVWCRDCPARLDDERPGDVVHRRWPPGQWLGILQEETP